MKMGTCEFSALPNGNDSILFLGTLDLILKKLAPRSTLRSTNGTVVTTRAPVISMQASP